jgi:hypothetical protein
LKPGYSAWNIVAGQTNESGLDCLAQFPPFQTWRALWRQLQIRASLWRAIFAVPNSGDSALVQTKPSGDVVMAIAASDHANNKWNKIGRYGAPARVCARHLFE